MSVGGRYPERKNCRPRSRERSERDLHRDRDLENCPRKERGDGRGQSNRDRERERHSRHQYDDSILGMRRSPCTWTNEKGAIHKNLTGDVSISGTTIENPHIPEPPLITGRPLSKKTSLFTTARRDMMKHPQYHIDTQGMGSPLNKWIFTNQGLVFWNAISVDIAVLEEVLEVLLNLLLVICAGVSFNASETYRDYGSLGGIYAYYFGGANTFTGTEAEKVKKLDTQFYQLKLPIATTTMAFGGALMGYTCLMLLLGLLRVPFRWLVECVLGVIIGLGYIPAMAFHFIKLQAYNSQICKDRNEMYASKGHQGFSCGFHGAEIASGLFGVFGILAFPFSAWLAVRAFKRVRELKKQPQDGHGF